VTKLHPIAAVLRHSRD